MGQRVCRDLMPGIERRDILLRYTVIAAEQPGVEVEGGLQAITVKQFDQSNVFVPPRRRS